MTQNTQYAFEMRDNRLGIRGDIVQKNPQLLAYVRQFPTSFMYDSSMNFWFFYPPEKCGAADAEITWEANQMKYKRPQSPPFTKSETK